MRWILYCVIIYSIVSYAYATTANISQVIFTTDQRTVDPDTLSEPMTIQAQNTGGAEEKLDSTADVTFVSSSQTGEFLGSTGKAVTKTMNSGSANKTFYYKDSSVGVHTITVTVVPRTGSGSWSTEQKVYIGVENPDPVEDEHSDTSDENDNNDEGEVSAHSKVVKLSTVNKKVELKISAGRSRTVLINTPIIFEAEANQGKSNIVPNIDYKWSFGDGDSKVGREVSHVYYFPGEYNVVLTGKHRREVAVSRIKVKVIDSLVTIASSSPGVHGFIELRNDSASEVNVNGWEIRTSGREYLISADTIIDAKSSVRIPNKIMNFEPSENINLIFPTDEIAYTYTPEKKVARIAPSVFIEDEKVAVKPSKEKVPVDELPRLEGKRNYATTVQAAAAALPERNWWAYIKSFFSVE